MARNSFSNGFTTLEHVLNNLYMEKELTSSYDFLKLKKKGPSVAPFFESR